MVKLTKAQRKAVKKIYDRDFDVMETYREFRKRVQPGSNCVMIKWCGMWLGIEPDGYTHS